MLFLSGFKPYSRWVPLQVTAPSINYQTTQIRLHLIEHFVKRFWLGDTFNADLYRGDLYLTCGKVTCILDRPFFFCGSLSMRFSRSKAEQWTKKKTIGDGVIEKNFSPPPSFSVSTSFQLSRL